VDLSELKEGQTGTVVRVGGDGPFRRRLLEMGFLRGTEVYVEKYAPLKDPIELILKGYHVSLRVDEAARIQVENVRDRR
jgi:Fe2+ transport system protein FeoA